MNLLIDTAWAASFVAAISAITVAVGRARTELRALRPAPLVIAQRSHHVEQRAHARQR